MTGIDACSRCQTPIAGQVLVCPSCSAFVHAAQLKQISETAAQSASAGDPSAALACWREALELVPAGTEQHDYISGQISALSRSLDDPPPQPPPAPAWVQKLGPAGAVLMFLWKGKSLAAILLSKGKILLLGFSKAGTVWSMLASFGAYAIEYGWKFGLGLVLSIYVHEMGHVWAARRYGVKASAPMFIPFIGAFITLQRSALSAREDAVISLGGPWWGAAGAAVTYALALASGSPAILAIAHTAAFMNLFNLLPVPPLDGSGAFRALSRPLRIAGLAVIGAAWFATHQRLLLLLAAAAVWQVCRKHPPQETDWRSLGEYAAVLTLLTSMLALAPALRSLLPE